MSPKKTYTPAVEVRPTPLDRPAPPAPAPVVVPPAPVVVAPAPAATQLDRIEALLKRCAARLQC